MSPPFRQSVSSVVKAESGAAAPHSKALRATFVSLPVYPKLARRGEWRVSIRGSKKDRALPNPPATPKLGEGG